MSWTRNVLAKLLMEEEEDEEEQHDEESEESADSSDSGGKEGRKKGVRCTAAAVHDQDLLTYDLGEDVQNEEEYDFAMNMALALSLSEQEHAKEQALQRAHSEKARPGCIRSQKHLLDLCDGMEGSGDVFERPIQAGGSQDGSPPGPSPNINTHPNKNE